MACSYRSGLGRKSITYTQERTRSIRVFATPDASSPGSKVEKWMKSPFDILAFGPRATVGALISIPKRLQTLPAEVERVQELIQDPRPFGEKQQLVLTEVEDTLLEFLEAGTFLEADIRTTIKGMLPPDVVRQVEQLIPPPPTNLPSGLSDMSQQEVVEKPDVTYVGDTLLESQLAAEMSEIRHAVVNLRLALEEVKTNQDPSKKAMLRLNLKDARDLLARRLNEAPPAAVEKGDLSLRSAMTEARTLVSQVDSQFF